MQLVRFGILSGTGSGVFVSSDEGKTWVSSNNGLTERKITALVTLGTYVFTGTQDSGVFLTTNNGLSWKSVNHGAYYVTQNNDTLRLQKVRALATTGTIIYAGTDLALFLSKDSGASWTSVNTTSLGLTNNPIQKIAVVGERIFLATRQDVFVSSDNGVSWKYLLQYQNILSFVVNGADVYGVGSDYNGGSGDGYHVWVSIDSGKSWVLSINGLNSQQNAWATSLAVNGTNVYLGTSYDGIYRSTDKGTTWVRTYLSYTDVEALAMIGNDLYAGTRYRGVIISKDSAASWKERNNGLTLSNIRSMTKMGGALFAGTDGGIGIYRSTNKGIDWVGVNNGLNDWQNLSLASNGTDLYFGGSTVYHSNDSGNNWTASEQYFGQVYTLATFDSMIITSVGTPFANFISSDKGKTWSQINSSLGGAFTGAFAQSNKNFYVGTSYGEGTQNQEGVYLSTNNGADWKQLSTVVDNSAIFSLAVIDTNLFAGTSYGVFLSTNRGLSWTQTNTGFNMSHVNKVIALAVSGSTIFAGTGDYGNGDGVYMSNNNGKSWNRINQGLLPSDITSLVVIDSNILQVHLVLAFGIAPSPISE